VSCRPLGNLNLRDAVDGSFGAIQIGMLHSLAELGITTDLVFGSSVGALNGTYYAGIPTIEGTRQPETIWRGLRRQDMFPSTRSTIIPRAPVFNATI
jgi:NTE family protein